MTNTCFDNKQPVSELYDTWNWENKDLSLFYVSLGTFLGLTMYMGEFKKNIKKCTESC